MKPGGPWMEAEHRPARPERDHRMTGGAGFLPAGDFFVARRMRAFAFGKKWGIGQKNGKYFFNSCFRSFIKELNITRLLYKRFKSGSD